MMSGSVWCICLDILSDIQLSCSLWTKTRHRFCLISSILIPDAQRNPFSCHYVEKGTVFNRWYPHSSWVSLLVSLTRGRPWDGILRYSSNLRYLPVRMPTTRQPNNEFKIYRPDIVWHYFHLGLRWQFSYNGSTQLNVIGTNGTHCIWHNWRNHHSPGKDSPEEGTGIIHN